ncbi:MAG: hypothetical protein EPN91_01575 [Salinibacterium sp.]|nr:MAG: hypothetical protein EPN91_01575 [Salinibacterium sp.]
MLAAVGIAIAVLLVGGGAFAAMNQQRIADQFTVWGFTASKTIAGYATRSGMNDEGRFLFYASKPVVEPEAKFDKICADHQEDEGILGCYLPDDKTIFLYDVTDKRLDGIEEVVASHEMLHAAWDRMSIDERHRVGPLLEAEAKKHAGDEGFAETLKYYAKAEPGERLNELHSIIGTEFSTISPALEAHYAKYFTDRSQVTALHEKSNAVFVELAAKTDALVAKINALVEKMKSDYANYKTGYQRLNSDIGSFNARADSGAITTESQFLYERNRLLARQNSLDALFSSIQAESDLYDKLVVQLKALNAQGAELEKAVNIKPLDPSNL